jgi:hypothetical protein
MGRLQPALSIGPAIDAEPPPVIWALDAFSKDFATHARTAFAIRAHAAESAIHPVYVLSDEVFLNRGYSSFLRAALKPRAHKNLIAIMEHELMIEIRRSGALRSPRVLIETSADASLCTKKLLRYAKGIGAQLVAIGANGRSSLSRWLTGSFAETLMRESPLPLLVTGPLQMNGLKSAKAIVLTTDFAAKDQSAFIKLLQMARARGLSVHLFPLRRDVPLIEANAWLDLADQLGVTAKLTTETFRDPTAAALIEYANGLEAASTLFVFLSDPRLSSNQGWLPASLTHDLIRKSPCPLYISGHI